MIVQCARCGADTISWIMKENRGRLSICDYCLDRWYKSEWYRHPGYFHLCTELRIKTFNIWVLDEVERIKHDL